MRRSRFLLPYVASDPLSAVVLRNEALRTVAVVGIVLLGAFGVVVATPVLTRTRGVPFDALAPLALLGVAVLLAFELLIYLRVRRLMGHRMAPRPWIWYASGFAEITMPTLVLLLIGRSFSNPAEVLGAPVSLLYFPMLALSVLRLDGRLSLTLGLAAALQYAGAVGWLSAADTASTAATDTALGVTVHSSIALALVLTGAACAVVARALRRGAEDAIGTARERERLHTLFGQHTDPAIVQALLAGGDDLERGKRQRVVALFLDVRGFTTFAEGRAPEEVVGYLNALFEIAVEAIVEEGGVVHQLLGDGLLALFGVPDARADDADRAVRAALATIDHTGEAVAAGALPPTRLGIGLHAGQGLVGLVGPQGHREYKVTGDAVNVASRVEQMNKTFGSSLLATDDVVGALADPPPMDDLGEVVVRGRAAAVRVFRLR